MSETILERVQTLLNDLNGREVNDPEYLLALALIDYIGRVRKRPAERGGR